MKIDVTQSFVEFDKSPLLASTQEKFDQPTCVTLRTVICGAIGSTFQTDANMSGKKKLELYHMGLEVISNKIVDWTSEQITLIKDRINQRFGILICAQAWLMLENKNVSETEEKNSGEKIAKGIKNES